MSKINVRVSGGQFYLNGKPELLRMRTSFKWLGWLWRNEEGQARKWLERCKEIGFHGVRALGEHHFWGGPFYGIEPLMKPWNLHQHGGSSFRMDPKHKEVLAKAIELLVEYDMLMEYVVIATVKGPDGLDPREEKDIVGWNSHAMRVTAEFFQEIGATNILPETINEFAAHAASIFEVRGEVYDCFDGKGRPTKRYRSELAAQARRWKERDWPGSAIGLSQAGGSGWDFDYPVGTASNAYTHINIHSPRHGQWELVGGPIDELRRMHPQCPVYLNENIHYMSQEEYDHWTQIIPKWAGLSTTNAMRVQSQWNSAYQHGASYCVHDLAGQASDPDAKRTRLEEIHKEQFNPDPPPPPPPEPPPPMPSKSFWQRVLEVLKKLLEFLGIKHDG